MVLLMQEHFEKLMRYLFLLLILGCSISEGQREVFRWSQGVDMPIGNYLMNCEWKKVDYETHWGNLYLNCEQRKEL